MGTFANQTNQYGAAHLAGVLTKFQSTFRHAAGHPVTQSGYKIKTHQKLVNMTNSQSVFRSVVAAFLSLIICAAIIVGVYLDLDHAIKDGNQAQLQYRR